MIKTYSIKEAMGALGIGRVRLMTAIRLNHVVARKMGERWIIDAQSIDDMFNKNQNNIKQSEEIHNTSKLASAPVTDSALQRDNKRR